MFKIEKNPKFWADVKVLVPIDDGHREDTFRARFKVQPAEMVEQYDILHSGGDLTEFLRATVVDLDQIADEDDATIAFSPDLLETIISNYGARLAMWNTYISAVTKARLGN
ncbi:phage tail assembly chaperone [Roseobacter sp. OBYS 0001]|uniref:phage tail assembly chaperone n=1 Tax=Roseobacter sp. OBYS 0001 TaxID=882651 RepID=UPI001BC6DD54|nr:phage tail assembly chaperone [Roseobacter sp. OBYS 0001]GIT85404.1 hypothetical protein ROBYS_04200 [Roseobacter sp. OBYS 0001]